MMSGIYTHAVLNKYYKNIYLNIFFHCLVNHSGSCNVHLLENMRKMIDI